MTLMTKQRKLTTYTEEGQCLFFGVGGAFIQLIIFIIAGIYYLRHSRHLAKCPVY